MSDDMNNGNWINGSCTCPIYFKRYVCKHIIGVAFRISGQYPLKCNAKFQIPKTSKIEQLLTNPSSYRI